MGQKFGVFVAMGLVKPMSIHNCMRVQMSYRSKVLKINGVSSASIPSIIGDSPLFVHDNMTCYVWISDT